MFQIIILFALSGFNEILGMRIFDKLPVFNTYIELTFNIHMGGAVLLDSSYPSHHYYGEAGY